MPPYTVAFGKAKNCIIVIILVVLYHWYRCEQLTVTSSLIERHLYIKSVHQLTKTGERAQMTNVVMKFVLTANRVKRVIT